MRRVRTVLMMVLVVSGLVVLAGCATAPTQQSQRDQLHEDVQTTINAFIRRDSTIERRFDDAHGYAVFPNIGKGGFLVGGSYGRGEVYEQGELIGYTSVTQGTIGLQAGGQSFSQVIFFQDKRSLDRFLQGQATFVANASAVAATAGAGASTKYRGGVMIFVLTRGGLMGELALGGQNFSFSPLRNGVPAVYGTTPGIDRPSPEGQAGGDLEQLNQQQRRIEERQRRLQRQLDDLEQQREQVEEQTRQEQEQEMERLQRQQDELERMQEEVEQRREQIQQSQQELEQQSQQRQQELEQDQPTR